MELKVGQKLWFVPASFRYSPHQVEISEIDGEDAPIGHCYPSEKYYLTRKRP